MGRFKRSAELLKQAWLVLKSDPELMVFPILSTLAGFAILASFALPVFIIEDLRHAFEQVFTSSKSHHHGVVATVTDSSTNLNARITVMAVMFGFYFVTSFVTIFFNSALLGAADRKFRGEPGGLAVGMQVAASRLPQILGWTLLSAIVGTILRAIEERVGIIGRIVIGLMGMSWALGTYFAVPALVIEGVGPFAAVGRSVSAIKKNWGEGIILGVGFGFVGFAVTMVGIGLIGAGVLAGILTQSIMLGVAIGLLGVIFLFAWMLVGSTLKAIVQMALYRYAIDGTVPNGFNAESLRKAFAPKKAEPAA